MINLSNTGVALVLAAMSLASLTTTSVSAHPAAEDSILSTRGAMTPGSYGNVNSGSFSFERPVSSQRSAQSEAIDVPAITGRAAMTPGSYQE